MEDDLDRIAAGEQERVDWLRHFYFGGGEGDEGLHARSSPTSARSTRVPSTRSRSATGSCSTSAATDLRRARRGARERPRGHGAGRADDREGGGAARSAFERPLARRAPEWGEITVKAGRYGPYVTEALPEVRPRSRGPHRCSPVDVARDGRARGRGAAALAAADALGVDPDDGVEVTAQSGRYGPYVKKDTESRSLEAEEQLFTITLDDALALLAQPKQRRGRNRRSRRCGDRPRPRERQAGGAEGGAVRPLRHRRRDERESPRGDDPDTVTIERAAELLANAARKAPRPSASAAAAGAQPRRSTICKLSVTTAVLFWRARRDALAWHARKPIPSPQRNEPCDSPF